MNITVIILGIVLVVLIYILYYYSSNTGNKLSTTADLKNVVPPITAINKPTNTMYGYTIWIYVNTWDNGSKTIFSKANNLKLYLKENTPQLNCDVTMNDGTTQTMIITDNFPIQKWVCIGISADNQMFDAYLDGKLVKSQRMFNTSTGSAPKVPGEEAVNLGNTPFRAFDAFIADFKRWTSPIDPQTAWTTYSAGNGNSSISKAIGSYGVNLSVLKDNIQQTQFTLL